MGGLGLRRRGILAGSAAPTYDEVVLADSPAGYWKLDETSGTTAADSSGNGRTLSKGTGVTVGASPVMPSGVRSFDFPGTSSTANRLAINDAAWQSPHAGASGQMTVECWAGFDTLAAIRTLWRKGAASNFEFGLEALTTGAVQFAVFTAAGGVAAIATSAAGVVTAGPGYHIVGTYDRAGNFVKVYVNGTEVATATTSANSADGTAVLEFGLRGSNTDRPMDGLASHLALYPTALSAARVLAHYNAA